MEIPLLGNVSWLLLLLCGLLVFLYYYTTSHFGIWEKVGLPGPKAYPIVGHILEMTDGLAPALFRWAAKYGRTYGTYGLVSKTPTLITTDAKLISHILVKDFGNFTDRHLGDITRSSILKGLIFQNGTDFKRHRNAFSPVFTGRRLRVMLPHANESAESLITLMKKTKAKGGLIPLKHFSEKFSSDLIAKTGFGVEADAVAEIDNEFSRKVEMYFTKQNPIQQAFRILSCTFPFLMDIGIKLYSNVDAINPEADKYFMSLARTALERKKEEIRLGQMPSAPRDILDIFLMSESENKKSKEERLTTEEIIGNSTTLIVAAYESTSRAIMTSLYFLARYPDIQEKVIEEVDRVMAGNTELTYEKLLDMKYVDQVLYETMRLFPPLNVAVRQTLETKTYEGITIPKGANIMIPIFQVFMDPEYFPDPEKFDPDRYGKEQCAQRDAILDLHFGYGPRLCIGKRLALMELRVLYCHMFSHMRFKLSDRTSPKAGEDLELETGFAIFHPKNPIQLDIELRQ